MGQPKKPTAKPAGAGRSQNATASKEAPARQSTPRLWYAAALAALLVIGSGVGYRALAARYAHLGESIPIPPETLAGIPEHLGEWEGREIPMDEYVVKATDTDAHVNRVYTDNRSAQMVSLYVAYGLRLRDLAPHRPEVCYPGAGWTLSEEQIIELAIAGGTSLPCRILHFQKPGLKSDQIVVLNYYIVDGQHCADVSLLRSQAWKLSGERHYSAQIQVTAGSSRFRDQAEQSVREFAALVAPEVERILTEAVAKATAPAAAN